MSTWHLSYKSVYTGHYLLNDVCISIPHRTDLRCPYAFNGCWLISMEKKRIKQWNSTCRSFYPPMSFGLGYAGRPPYTLVSWSCHFRALVCQQCPGECRVLRQMVVYTLCGQISLSTWLAQNAKFGSFVVILQNLWHKLWFDHTMWIYPKYRSMLIKHLSRGGGHEQHLDAGTLKSLSADLRTAATGTVLLMKHCPWSAVPVAPKFCS